MMNHDQIVALANLLKSLSSYDLVSVLQTTFDEVGTPGADKQIVVHTGLYEWSDTSVRDVPENPDYLCRLSCLV